MLGKVECRQGSGRYDGGVAVGRLLARHGGHAAVVRLLMLCLQGVGRGQGRSGQEEALAVVDRLRLLRRGFDFGFLTGRTMAAISDGLAMAIADTVATHYATAVVDGVVLVVNAGGLAVAGAESALDALVGIDLNFQPAKARKESEEGSDGADGVAIGAAVLPGERNDNRQADERQDECGHAFEQYFMAVEGVAIEVGGHGGQEVVAANVEGLEQMGDHASVTAVGSQQCYQSGCAGDVGDDHEGQQAIAQRGFGFGKEVAVAFLAVVQPGYAILKDA